jgi:hypothetical protein
MKDILIDGHRFLTSDDVADAVMDYARLLHLTGGTDVVEFAGIHEGEVSRCALLLGCSGSLAVVDAGVGLPSTLSGADTDYAEIARRADALR